MNITSFRINPMVETYDYGDVTLSVVRFSKIGEENGTCGLDFDEVAFLREGQFIKESNPQNKRAIIDFMQERYGISALLADSVQRVPPEDVDLIKEFLATL